MSSNLFSEIDKPATVRRNALKRELLDWVEHVVRDRALPPSATVVATGLASYLVHSSCDEWPAIATLAEELGFTEKTVRCCIRALRERGRLSFGLCGLQNDRGAR